MEIRAEDLRIDVFRNGSHVVRITHMPSGAVGKGAHASYLAAREQAMGRLREKLQDESPSGEDDASGTSVGS